MPTFAKPPAARDLEARARARRLRVRVEVVSHARAYTSRSQSNPGETYDLTRTRDGWLCACAGYYHTGCCKHLGQLERRAEREGWDFGRVCPLALADRHGPVVGTVRVVGGDQRDAAAVAATLAAQRAAALRDLYGDEAA